MTSAWSNIAAYEHELLGYLTQGLLSVPGLRLIGTAHEKAGVASFVLDECRSEDVGKALAQEGIAVRAGHHCAQPILRRFGLEATVRAVAGALQHDRGHRRSRHARCCASRPAAASAACNGRPSRRPPHAQPNKQS